MEEEEEEEENWKAKKNEAKIILNHKFPYRLSRAAEKAQGSSGRLLLPLSVMQRLLSLRPRREVELGQLRRRSS